MKRVISFILAAVLLAGAIMAVCSCTSGAKAMEYEGYSFSEGMYRYWMKNWKSYYIKNYSDVEDTAEYWNAENGTGKTNAEYLTEQIETRIKYYLIAQKLFDDYGLKLDSQTLAGIDEDIESGVDYYGSKGEYNNALREEYGINMSVLKQIYTAEEKYTAVYAFLYDNVSGINSATPDELDAYYHKYYSRVKYVMFFREVKYKYDEDGKIMTDSNGYYQFEDLTEEEKEKVRQTVTDVYEQVKNGADIGPFMTEHMKVFGYDESKYPNGYYISADDYTSHTAAVTAAALEMDIGEVRLLQEESCYYVIQKFELIDKAYTASPDSDQFYYLISYCNNEKFSKEFNGYAENVTVNTSVTSNYPFEEL